MKTTITSTKNQQVIGFVKDEREIKMIKTFIITATQKTFD